MNANKTPVRFGLPKVISVNKDPRPATIKFSADISLGVKLRHGLPFDVVIPNETTEKTFKDTDAELNLMRFDNADDMFRQPIDQKMVPAIEKQEVT